MKVVLDTNVVVSGVFFGGVPGRILTAWTEGEIVLVLSPSILEEYRRVGRELGLKYSSLSSAFEPLLALIAMHAMIVDAPLLDETVSVTIRTMTCSWPPRRPRRPRSSSPEISIFCGSPGGEASTC